MKKRLYIFLKSKAFFWFRDKGKKYELRVYRRQWTEKNVYKGRPVELRRGYNTKDRIRGKVGKVIVGTIKEIFSKVKYKEIIPLANSQKEAIKIINEILGKKEKYVAIEIKI